jgi:hypothetical protein
MVEEPACATRWLMAGSIEDVGEEEGVPDRRGFCHKAPGRAVKADYISRQAQGSPPLTPISGN